MFFITDKDVKKYLQLAAKEALGIDDPKVLSKWTSHSLRVTAANELHRLGFSNIYIKHRLRWRLDVFPNYLRHTIHIARNHTKAMSLNKANLAVQKSNFTSGNKKWKISKYSASLERMISFGSKTFMLPQHRVVMAHSMKMCTTGMHVLMYLFFANLGYEKVSEKWFSRDHDCPSHNDFY